MKHDITGYESPIVIAFLEAHGERQEDGRFAFFNDRRVVSSNKDMIARWELRDTVPLGRLDDFLMRYGLMLYEFDLWASETFGRTGWADPQAEPSDLAA